VKAKLVESYEIAPEIRHFVFEVPEVENLPYLSGQFVSFSNVFGEKKITRAYSTAAPPQGNRFELCLNRVKDGRFSPHLFSLQPGDVVEMRGPIGHFVLKNPPNDSIMVATGTGIAPFRGIVNEAVRKHPERQFTLVFGARFEHGLLYRDEFEALAKEYPNFHFVPTLSRPPEEWKGRVGHVQAHVLEFLGERRDVDIYICGMKAMVDDLRNRLKELGLDRTHIIFEKYD
jgi:CDP-4-dehydro-6-deoxyglucose reductase